MKRITGSRCYRLAGPLALAILQTCQVAQAEEETDTNKFTISGDFRTGWLNYDYSNPDGLPTINKGHKDSQGFYITPKISLNTPVYYGFSGKVTVAGATDFGINSEDKQSRLFVFDPVEQLEARLYFNELFS